MNPRVKPFIALTIIIIVAIGGFKIKEIQRERNIEHYDELVCQTCNDAVEAQIAKFNGEKRFYDSKDLLVFAPGFKHSNGIYMALFGTATDFTLKVWSDRGTKNLSCVAHGNNPSNIVKDCRIGASDDWFKQLINNKCDDAVKEIDDYLNNDGDPRWQPSFSSSTWGTRVQLPNTLSDYITIHCGHTYLNNYKRICSWTHKQGENKPEVNCRENTD